VRLSVGDDGPGLSPDLIPHIFERFASSRAPGEHGATRRHYGLGLALVQKIVVTHNGRVSAASGPAGGGRITIVLPVTDQT